MSSLFSNMIIGFTDIIGMIGVFLILLMYFLLQTDKVEAKGKSFSLINLIGSGCILYSLLFDWNLPSVIIEIVWLLISLWGTVRAFTRKKKAHEHAS